MRGTWDSLAGGMTTRLVAIVSIFACMLVSFTAVAASDEAVRAIPTDVAFVVSGGFWEDGERHGSHRVVVLREGREHTTASAFVQWVELDVKGVGESVFATEPVPALQKMIGATIANVTVDESVKSENAFVMELRARDSQERSTRRLVVGKPGVMRLEPD